MNIAEIYEKFDTIGSLTFATIDCGYPQTRIAHLFAYDDDGLYFRTMYTKPFYSQLKSDEKVSLCGMYPASKTRYDADGMPYFEPGYAIRATGDVKEIAFDDLKKKAGLNQMFMLGVKDIEKYPAMVTFCLYRAWGEIFDFDFAMEHRDHKLLRTDFSFGGKSIPARGMRITEACISCGECAQRCSFKAISEGKDRFVIDRARCDVCGDCHIVCPADAIEIVIGKVE
ncbi:MAG: 4Fe-4S binding protein [Desulfopila sp.]